MPPSPLDRLGSGTWEPGEGNLQLAALIASIVGPYRVAHGAKHAVVLEPDEPKRVSSNSPASRHCLFVALYLPMSRTGPLFLTVGQEDTPGDSAGIPVALQPELGHFSAVLLPGEQLYAVSPLACRFVISEVSF